MFTNRDLSAWLADMGLKVPEGLLWTSALATAEFVATQRPGGSAYVIGESGLTTVLHEVGYVITNRDPDYVILGETRNYSFDASRRPSGSSARAAASCARTRTPPVRRPSVPSRPAARWLPWSSGPPGSAPTSSESRTRS